MLIPRPRGGLFVESPKARESGDTCDFRFFSVFFCFRKAEEQPMVVEGCVQNGWQ